MKHKTLILSIMFCLLPITTFSGEWRAMTSGTTQQLTCVWGSSGSDVFAVGDRGTILHYNGNSWSAMTSGTSYDLWGVWGSSGSNVFAVGSSGTLGTLGTILRYNGSTWSTMSSGMPYNLYAIWGSSGSDVFAVGYRGTILHYNGNSWSAMTSDTSYDLWGVWGSSGNDVFAVGDDGTIVHYNGSTWSTMNSGVPSYNFNDIWGSSGNDVFAMGYEGVGGTILQYDGTIWSPVMKADKTLSFASVWGSSHNDVFAVGLDVALIGIDSSKQNTIYHYDGTTWSLMTVGYSVLAFNGVWGSSNTDVFAVGRDGAILHYGESVSTTTISTTTTTTVPPTVVSLIGFNAIPGNRIVTLFWSTASEINNAGFNLYRAEVQNGIYNKINADIIPAQGSSTQGASYEFIDREVKNRKTYYYKLEDIDLNGTATMYGPVSAMPRWILGFGK